MLLWNTVSSFEQSSVCGTCTSCIVRDFLLVAFLLVDIFPWFPKFAFAIDGSSKAHWGFCQGALAHSTSSSTPICELTSRLPNLARVFKILDLTLTIKYVHEKSFRNGMLRHGIRVQKIVVVKVCTVRGAKALYLQLGLIRCDIRRLSRSLARSHVSIDCQRSRVELAMSAPLFTCALPAWQQRNLWRALRYIYDTKLRTVQVTSVILRIAFLHLRLLLTGRHVVVCMYLDADFTAIATNW